MHLSKISIVNYKGIENLEVFFSPKINIIVGENGSCKSALIDAIRLLYNLGEPTREITITKEDFFDKVSPIIGGGITIQRSDLIKITYEFKELSAEQKGAFYEYMVVDTANTGNDYAKIEIQYKQDKRYPIFSYNTGNIDGQKADVNTFRLFQHYYLSALRDSTKDLLNVRGNILGKVIKRLVERNDSEDEIKDIIKEANTKLLQRGEVTSTRDSINDNLGNIYKNANTSQIGLHIEQSRIEYIVNVIKPFLPHDWQNNSVEGFQLWQNSLGFNNLIYIATVLGDIKERALDDVIPHFALLIEEPEAHIHPQLQLSLYNFLKEASQSANSQLFITTHSPTLTSKVPFENLILLEQRAYTISESFTAREAENIIQDTTKTAPLTQADIDIKKNQLQRYVDVTKSQLFFAKGCLFVEGISEELLISAFCQVEGFNLEDYRIELVNVDGVSFYPFLFLFNSTTDKKRLPKKIAVLTDDDRFPKAKSVDYSLNKLVENDYVTLNTFYTTITTSTICNRVNNLNSISNGQAKIAIKSACQTMEFDLCQNNIADTKTDCLKNFLFKYISKLFPTEIGHVNAYLQTLPEQLNQQQKDKIAILLWKCLPGKAVFAQDFSLHIVENLVDAKLNFKVPAYIKAAFTHLKQ
ncbi:MAG TPA: ATP-dependent endonuclease [Mucilaginibacter sp.]|jgi:putative ATP-dependent endonuclease of OLD family|nr:ATP-dependent endonuclease [Mucilaginibacter sp.]